MNFGRVQKLIVVPRRGFNLVKGLNEVVIVGAARTPIGSYKGALSGANSPYLGAVAIKAAISRSGVPAKEVQEVYMGCVLQGGLGQDPARQATIFSGLPESTPTTTINKVCASGMKAIMLAAQNIASGAVNVMVAGGMDSMTNAPFLLKRAEPKYGGDRLVDLLVNDGLTDVYTKVLMGTCAEKCAADHGLTRQKQDDFAIESYKRSQAAAASGAFVTEITPVQITVPKETLVSEDEEVKRAVLVEKVRAMRPAFTSPDPATLTLKKGEKLPSGHKWSPTITGANASKLSDGAAACVLTSEKAAQRLRLKPLARIVGFADGAVQPVDFPVAPLEAIKKLLAQTGVKKEDIAWWEVNEAFSVVALANLKLLGLDPARVNPNGGAVSLGHPLGMSGARITNILALHMKPGQKGVAAICNGGGGASAIMIEKL